MCARLIYPGLGDLHRHPGAQEHHRVQPVSEADAERGAAGVGGRLHRRVRRDVAAGHCRGHWPDRGGAGVGRSDPGRPGGPGGGHLRLHHLHGDPATRAQLPGPAAAEGAVHPAGLQRHGGAHLPGLAGVTAKGSTLTQLDSQSGVGQEVGLESSVLDFTF